MKTALFLDLDGTLINTKSGETFPQDMNDWVLNMDIIELIKEAKKLSMHLVIVTNQGGIATGNTKEAEFLEKLLNICAEVERLTGYKFGKNFRYYYSPSMNRNNYYRKPNPGMAYQAALDMEILLPGSVMVGDASGKPNDFSASDLNFAINANIGQYYDVNSIPDKNPLLVLVRKDKLPFNANKADKLFWDDITG